MTGLLLHSSEPVKATLIYGGWFYKTTEELDLPLKMITKPDEPATISRPPCIARICQGLPPEVRDTLNMVWYEFEFCRDIRKDIRTRMYQWYQILHGYDSEWWGGRVCNLSTRWELVRVRLPNDAVSPVPEYVKV